MFERIGNLETEEKIHKYFTVARRSIDYCDMYDDMGDAEDFIKELRMTLPTKDESYEKKEIIWKRF